MDELLVYLKTRERRLPELAALMENKYEDLRNEFGIGDKIKSLEFLRGCLYTLHLTGEIGCNQYREAYEDAYNRALSFSARR